MGSINCRSAQHKKKQKATNKQLFLMVHFQSQRKSQSLSLFLTSQFICFGRDSNILILRHNLQTRLSLRYHHTNLYCKLHYRLQEHLWCACKQFQISGSTEFSIQKRKKEVPLCFFSVLFHKQRFTIFPKGMQSIYPTWCCIMRNDIFMICEM